MIDARALLVAMLDAIERDPELRARLRAVLTDEPPKPAWISIGDAGVSKRALREAIGRGELNAKKVGRELCIEVRALNAWMETREAYAPKPRPERKKTQPTSDAADVDALFADLTSRGKLTVVR